MKAPILSTEGVTVRFGGNTALSDMSVDAIEGVVTGLIGPNGAGKTTCFNVITGVYQATSGDVTFRGGSLKGRKRYQVGYA